MPTPAEQQFIDAWRYAAPRLEEIKRQELRQLDENAGLRMIAASQTIEPASSGLIQFQAWMMRLRVTEMQKLIAQHNTQAASPQ